MVKDNSLYSSIAQSVIGRYSVYISNVMSIMILARMFTPDTFGIIAAVTVFALFFQLVGEAGLGPAIINLDTLLQDDRNGMFSLTLIVGVCGSAGFLSLGNILSEFYSIDRINEVIPYVSISLFFFTANVLPNAFLQRERFFLKIACIGLITEIISTTCVVVLSSIVNPLHALAAKIAISAISSFLLTYYFSGKTEFGRPFLGRKLSAIIPLLKFSSYQFGFNIIISFAQNLDNILVGKYFGYYTLGIYDKAYQLMRYPLTLLTFAMTPAIQPVIKNYSNDINRVESIHVNFTFKLSLLGWLSGLCIFLWADIIVLIIFGSQWVAVVPIIRILSISIPIQVVLATSGSFFQAMNRPDILFFSGSISALLMVFSIVAGVVFRDVILLSWLLVATFYINFFQTYYFMYRKVFFRPLYGFVYKMLPMLMLSVFLVIVEIFFKDL
ncbi:oligosaccharide flippase family protein [Shewanella dokdonensis]|uniref:oligosaccharide flippase family protein n=1 Tax=Shewanella dokdonensis TaxID=712036 RepID=UPI00200EB288|nr:oligosaccharide flippase family protein [Shewanella dokdonensis]MCL1073884.1 oligosaccharide flippase family protein [Shewanella dokdonensis]